MTKDQARAIIDGFKADGLCLALSEDIIGTCYFRSGQRIQVWLATKSRLASDALWDKNENAALHYLCKLRVPLSNKQDNATVRHESEAKGGKLMGTWKKRRDIIGSPMDTPEWAARKWSTVKAVRSKGGRR